MKKKIDISVFGRSFTVRSEHDEAYMHRVANYVTRAFENMRNTARTANNDELGLLVAMNMADEFFQEKMKLAEKTAEIESRLESLNNKLTKIVGSSNATTTQQTMNRHIEMKDVDMKDRVQVQHGANTTQAEA